MSYESGQLDAIDRQMMDAGAPQKASEWTEIGEAEITYTISGKAKVRIKRKHDKMRQVVFLCFILAIAILAWQGWGFYDRTEQQAIVPDSAPIKSTGVDSEQASSPTEKNVESNPDQPTINKIDEQQQNQDVKKEAKQTAMKPFVRQPMVVMRPQPASAATNSSPSINQTDTQLQSPLSSKTTVSPTTVPLHSTQAAASSSASSTTIVTPMNNAELPNSSSDGGDQKMDQNGVKP